MLQRARGEPCIEHLALGPLPGVKEEALLIPAQKVGVVISVACWDLAARPQRNEFSIAHISPIRSAATFLTRLLSTLASSLRARQIGLKGCHASYKFQSLL